MCTGVILFKRIDMPDRVRAERDTPGEAVDPQKYPRDSIPGI